MVAGEPALRILQVASSLYDWGGIERYVVHLSDGLAARGHEVVVACPKSSPLDKRVNVERVSISVKHKISLPVVLQYMKLFKKGKFDVVHAHFSPDFLAPAIAAKLTHQPFTIMTRHVAVTWRAAKVQQYTRLFDHFIPVSGAVFEKLQQSGIPAERMTVAKAGCPALGCGRDLDDVRAELGFEGFTTGVFGRLVRDKGIDLAIKAAGLSGTRVAVFGDGPEKVSLERLAEASDGHARLYGFREDVADCMSAVDAVVIPSRWTEPFPYSALEAMSLGKPIIAANVGGLPEMIEDGKTGLLFEKDNPEDLARCIRRIQDEPVFAREMAANAQQVHRSLYTVEKMAERIEAVYREQLARRGR